MFVQGGNHGQQRGVEAGQLAAGVVFQFFQVQRQADDRFVGVVIGAAVDFAFENFHGRRPWVGRSEIRDQRLEIELSQRALVAR